MLVATCNLMQSRAEDAFVHLLLSTPQRESQACLTAACAVL